MRPIRDVAAEMVRTGMTTLEELDRVLGESAQAGPAEPAEAERAPAILVADDDPLIRTMARALLERQGFRVTEAGDGAAALASLRSGGVDLLILDLNMPETDGRAVLKAVRGSTATAGLPVVVLTGEQDEALEVALMDEGADDYFRKPIEPARFVARIKGALRRAGA